MTHWFIRDDIAMTRIRRIGPAAAIAVLVLAALLAAPGARRAQAFFEGSCGLIDFDSVYFEDGGRRGWYLYVGGSRRFANMDVFLDHKQGHRGEWIIEVVGCTKNALVLPIPTPYVIELPIRELPGARRLRIIGASGSVRRVVPGV